MPKRKIKKKELVRPDEFEAVGFEFFRWIAEAWRRVRENPGRYGTWAGTVVLALGLGLGVWGYQGRRATHAEEQFAGILLDYQALREKAAASRSDPAKPEGQSEDSWLKDSAALQEKLKGFVGLGGVPSNLKNESFFLLGNVSLRRGEAKEAVEWLGRFDREASAADPLRPLAWSSLGYAYEALSDAQRAVDYFRKAADSGSAGAAEATLELAHNLVHLDKKDEARKVYEEYVKKYADSTGVAIARAELSQLGSAPVAPGS